MPVDRVAGERARLHHAIARMRAALTGLELAMTGPADVPIGVDSAQAVTTTASEILTCVSKMDAYQRAQNDHEDRR